MVGTTTCRQVTLIEEGTGHGFERVSVRTGGPIQTMVGPYVREIEPFQGKRKEVLEKRFLMTNTQTAGPTQMVQMY